MPIYCFRNKVTQEVHELILSLSQRDQYLMDHPEIEYVISPPNIGDSVRLGIRRPDAGFKEVLQKIHQRTPGSQLDKTTNLV